MNTRLGQELRVTGVWLVITALLALSAWKLTRTVAFVGNDYVPKTYDFALYVPQEQADDSKGNPLARLTFWNTKRKGVVLFLIDDNRPRPANAEGFRVRPPLPRLVVGSLAPAEGAEPACSYFGEEGSKEVRLKAHSLARDFDYWSIDIPGDWGWSLRCLVVDEFAHRTSRERVLSFTTSEETRLRTSTWPGTDSICS